jgi:adenylyltransferase/sulfurtransferase
MNDYSKYQRQIAFYGLTQLGQKKLLSSKVVILGVGGLGSVSSQMLVRAGVGTVRIVDNDIVEERNLHRQILHSEEDARNSRTKVESAAQKLRNMNSDVNIDPVFATIDKTTIESLCQDFDLVIDGTDNVAARCVINEYCVNSMTPWIFGAALEACGQTMNIMPGETACYGCLAPNVSTNNTLDTCRTHGVIGAVVSIIGSVQACEAIKMLSGFGETSKSLLTVDLWVNSFERIDIERIEDCVCCKEAGGSTNKQ